MKGYEQKFIVQIVGKTVEILAEEWEDRKPKNRARSNWYRSKSR